LPILKEGELDIISHSAEQTQRLGQRLGQLLRAGDLVCMTGDMGAGKTVFASGIGQGFGSKTPVTSPTFNLAHQHSRPQDKLLLYHMDCYRLRDADDAASVGLDDILDGTHVAVLEWAERIRSVLPAERLWIQFRVREEMRRNLILEASGERHRQLLELFRESAFGF
jgi:tRNA threonylcarbamoyladenosine biosynthesis protein TsaE